MFFYDVFGILFLVLIGGFSLFLPLAACALLVWVFAKLRSRMVHHWEIFLLPGLLRHRKVAKRTIREASQFD